MNASDVLALVRAGYTRAEIDAMDQPNPSPDPAPTPEPEPTPEPTPEPEPAPAPASQDQGYSNLMAAIAKTVSDQVTAAIQAVNLGAAVLPTNKPDDIQSVMAEIINPTTKKE